MALWLKILIVILAIHYLLAITVLFLVLKDNLRVADKTAPIKVKLICWNLIVLLLPIVGPVCYLIYRMIAKPQNAPISSRLISSTAEDTNEHDNLQIPQNDITTKEIQIDSSNTPFTDLVETDKNTIIKDEDK